MKRAISPIKSNAGVSLLEVLITMFVMAIALLGSAQLQAYSLKVNQGSQFRAEAVILGTDLLERIEANNVAAIAGTYAATLPSGGSVASCASSGCTAAGMAAYDLNQIQQAMARQLPEATATVTFTANSPLAGQYTYTVQINWKERISRQKSL